MKLWRMLIAICLVGTMVFAFAACAQTEEETQKPTEKTEPTTDVVAPTGEGTEINNESLLITIDPETYKEFIGSWYADGSSASYRLNIKDTGTWEMTDYSGDVAASGSLRMNDEDETLELYDPDGSLAITVMIEEEGVIHVEIMLESLSDSLSTNYFYNKITNDISDAPPSDITDDSSFGELEDDLGSVPPVEDSLPVD